MSSVRDPMDEYRLLIGGRMVAGDAHIAVINPANETIIAQSPRASAGQLNDAVAAAKTAFPKWRATSPDERRRMLLDAAKRISDNRDALARLLTLEQGKPIADAAREIMGTAGYFRYFASLDLPGETFEDSDKRGIEAHYVPLGVVAAIVPWNFPMALMGFKVPAALAAGNTVVLKPAATTPLTTLKFAELVHDVFPPGVLNVISDANDLGALLSSHPGIAKISFTGSTATGAKVMAGAAPTLKRLTLELGGNDAGIVLDDCDPEKLAPLIFHSAFRNSGQVCIALKRLYVQDGIYDTMCDALAGIAAQTIVGDGLEQGTQLGPLQNRAQYEKVLDLIADAKTHGRVIAGGAAPSPGYFIRPTVVRDISDGTRLVDEEQFGPVLPVIRFSDAEDALARANASPFGLGGSIWSFDLQRAHALAIRMEAGTVWINKHGELSPEVPFGGVKQSGFGLELGREGLGEFMQPKIVNAAR